MENQIVCNDCGLRYEVIFSNDALRAAGIELPDNFCPGCGSDKLTLPKPEESEDATEG